MLKHSYSSVLIFLFY